MKAQGATEYLVLLAVALIVALVSVALLGLFPKMASDSQIAQSQATIGLALIVEKAKKKRNKKERRKKAGKEKKAKPRE